MIRFKVADLSRELNAMDGIANRFLERGSAGSLKRLSESLTRIQRSGRPAEWAIGTDAPIETQVSDGSYQPDDRGNHEVYAEISMLWDVKPVGNGEIEVFDRASTRVTFHGDAQIGVVSMDLGDANAPGCFFHCQVSSGSSSFPFPKDFDVPRFPSLVPTPASVLEFTLSELFQDRWQRHAQAHQSRSTWISSQKIWWLKSLAWQEQRVRAARYSPWVELKRSLPRQDIFV